MKKKTVIFLAVIFAILIVTALVYDHNFGQKSKQIFAMDTYCSLEIKGNDDVLNEMQELILRYDEKYDAHDETSEISVMNQKGIVTDAETVAIIKKLAKLSKDTDGTFDFTMKRLSDAWGFNTDTARVPENIDFSLFGAEKLEIKDDTVYLNGVHLDFGGVMKGYVTDLLSNMLREQDVDEAVLNLGGNVYARGKHKIGIKDPVSNGVALSVEVSDKAVITSGIYQRNFTDKNGNLWHHILNPKTGYPADSGLISVTVIGDNATECDVLSTAFLVMGKEKAIEKSKNFDVELILIEEGRLYYSKGLEQVIEVFDNYKNEVF